MSEILTPNRFYDKAMEQLDGYLPGREQQKKDALAGLVLGLPTIYYGGPGGGKTRLAKGVPELIQGMGDKTLWVPANSDLAPSTIAGAEMITKEVEDGEEYTKTTIIDGLLDEETEGLILDEITRMSPFALNALLRVIEEGEVVGNGIKKHIDLLMQISTANPSEQGQSTFKISNAAISRHAIGIPFFRIRDYRTSGKHAGNKFNIKPIDPIASKEDVLSIRDIAETYETTEQQDDLMGKFQVVVGDVLEERKIFEELDERPSIQLGKIVRAKMALAGQPVESSKRDSSVTEEIISDSARLLLNARIGTKKLSSKDHDELYADIEARVDSFVA